jgi:hypothetical protein
MFLHVHSVIHALLTAESKLNWNLEPICRDSQADDHLTQSPCIPATLNTTVHSQAGASQTTSSSSNCHQHNCTLAGWGHLKQPPTLLIAVSWLNTAVHSQSLRPQHNCTLAGWGCLSQPPAFLTAVSRQHNCTLAVSQASTQLYTRRPGHLTQPPTLLTEVSSLNTIVHSRAGASHTTSYSSERPQHNCTLAGWSISHNLLLFWEPSTQLYTRRLEHLTHPPTLLTALNKTVHSQAGASHITSYFSDWSLKPQHNCTLAVWGHLTQPYALPQWIISRRLSRNSSRLSINGLGTDRTGKTVLIVLFHCCLATNVSIAIHSSLHNSPTCTYGIIWKNMKYILCKDSTKPKGMKILWAIEMRYYNDKYLVHYYSNL